MCEAVYVGKNCRSSFLRHLRAHNDPDHEELHRLVTETGTRNKGDIQLRRERDARHRKKHPTQSTAIKRFSRIKGQVLRELTTQHQDVKPEKLEYPQFPITHAVHSTNNRYWLLEEHLRVYVGRATKFYTWHEANAVFTIC